MRNLFDSPFLINVRNYTRGEVQIPPAQLFELLDHFADDLSELSGGNTSLFTLLRYLKLSHIELCSSYRFIEEKAVKDGGLFLSVLWKARALIEMEIDMVNLRIEHPGIAGEHVMPDSPLFWSQDFTVTDLMELIVALHTCGALLNSDGSQASLAAVVRIMEQAFNIRIKDYFGLKANVTARKIKPTKFLDLLTANFIRVCDCR